MPEKPVACVLIVGLYLKGSEHISYASYYFLRLLVLNKALLSRHYPVGVCLINY